MDGNVSRSPFATSPNPSPIGRGLSILLMATAIVVLCWGLHEVRGIVVPLLAAGFIAMLAVPLLVLLQRTLRIPRWLSLLLVLTLTIGAVMGLGFLLAQSIAGVTPELPIYQQRLESSVLDVTGWLKAHGVNLSQEEAIARVKDWSLSSGAGTVLGGVANLLQSTTLVVLVTAFILAEASTMPEKIRMAFPNMSGGSGLQSVADKVRTYLAVVTQLNILMGLVTYIACLVFKVPFAELLAFLVFFLNYIPTLGAIVGGALPAVFALVTVGWGAALGMGIVEAVLGVVVGTTIQPRLLGSRLGLSPLVILLSLVVWGGLLGAVGMFFAVPLTIILKIVLDSTDDLKWLGILLGDGRSVQRAPATKPPTA